MAPRASAWGLNKRGLLASLVNVACLRHHELICNGWLGLKCTRPSLNSSNLGLGKQQ